MDILNIGSNIQANMLMHIHAVRGTGRTMVIVEIAKDGDIIWFPTEREAKRVERLLREKGTRAKCISVPPKDGFNHPAMRGFQGRVLFDHTWVEEYYKMVVQDANRTLDNVSRQYNRNVPDFHVDYNVKGWHK